MAFGISMSQKAARSLILRWQTTIWPALVQDTNRRGRLLARRLADSPLVRIWDDLSGGARATAARNQVDRARTDLIDIRRSVELTETKMDSIRDQLRVIREQLDQMPRTDSRYLALVRDEHVLLRGEQECMNQVSAAQQKERHQFESLCSALEFANTVDNDRTKYFSIVATVLGTIIGAIGSSFAASSRQAIIHQRLDSVEHALHDLASTITITSDSSDASKPSVEMVPESVAPDLSQELRRGQRWSIAATATSIVTLLYLFFAEK